MDARPVDRRTKPGRRREIAEAALQVMAEYGLAATTNSRVAEAVGITASAVYVHFKNRQELLEAAMDVLVERIQSWHGRSSNPDVGTRLREIGDCHASFLAGELGGFVAPSFEFIASPPGLGLAQRFGSRIREPFENLTGIVDEGKAQGSIRPDLDSRVVAWELIMFAWAEDVARLIGLDEFVQDGISRQILGILLDHATATDTLGVEPARGGDPR